MGEPVQKKHADDEQDDGPNQIAPGLNTREEDDYKIHYKKNHTDAVLTYPAGPGTAVQQKKTQADGH